MAQKSAKKKTKETAKASSDPSVLGNLRSSRPTRIGGERRAATTTRSTSAKAGAKGRAATTQATTAKPAAATRPATPPPPTAEPPRDGRPSTSEVVTTAVQAAGELASIGLTVGRQVLKRAAGRIPRP